MWTNMSLYCAPAATPATPPAATPLYVFERICPFKYLFVRRIESVDINDLLSDELKSMASLPLILIQIFIRNNMRNSSRPSTRSFNPTLMAHQTTSETILRTYGTLVLIVSLTSPGFYFLRTGVLHLLPSWMHLVSITFMTLLLTCWKHRRFMQIDPEQCYSVNSWTAFLSHWIATRTWILFGLSVSVARCSHLGPDDDQDLDRTSLMKSVLFAWTSCVSYLWQHEYRILLPSIPQHVSFRLLSAVAEEFAIACRKALWTLALMLVLVSMDVLPWSDVSYLEAWMFHFYISAASRVYEVYLLTRNDDRMNDSSSPDQNQMTDMMSVMKQTDVHSMIRAALMTLTPGHASPSLYGGVIRALEKCQLQHQRMTSLLEILTRPRVELKQFFQSNSLTITKSHHATETNIDGQVDTMAVWTRLHQTIVECPEPRVVIMTNEHLWQDLVQICTTYVDAYAFKLKLVWTMQHEFGGLSRRRSFVTHHHHHEVHLWHELDRNFGTVEPLVLAYLRLNLECFTTGKSDDVPEKKSQSFFDQVRFRVQSWSCRLSEEGTGRHRRICVYGSQKLVWAIEILTKIIVTSKMEDQRGLIQVCTND